MVGLTFNESKLLKQITSRLECISSPALRMQAILHFSQTVDILFLGDICGERELSLINEVDELQEKVNLLSVKHDSD